MRQSGLRRIDLGQNQTKCGSSAQITRVPELSNYAFNIRVSLIEPAYTRSVFDQNALEPDAKLKEYDHPRASSGRDAQSARPSNSVHEAVNRRRCYLAQ